MVWMPTRGKESSVHSHINRQKCFLRSPGFWTSLIRICLGFAEYWWSLLKIGICSEFCKLRMPFKMILNKFGHCLQNDIWVAESTRISFCRFKCPNLFKISRYLQTSLESSRRVLISFNWTFLASFYGWDTTIENKSNESIVEGMGHFRLNTKGYVYRQHLYTVT